MTYVPVVPPTQIPPPSPRTRELSQLLAKVLDEYTKAHPATTKAEVRAAIRMAQMSAGPDGKKLAAGLSLGVGLGVMMLTLGLFFFRSSGEVEMGASMPMIIMTVIIFLGLVAGLIAIKSR